MASSIDYKDGSSLGLARTATSLETNDIDLPTVESIVSNLQEPSSLLIFTEEPEGTTLTDKEQEEMFRALQEVLSKTERDGDTFDVQGLRDALEMGNTAAQQGQRGPQLLGGVDSILRRLWHSNSRYMIEAAEAMANASRDPSWRIPFGQSGVLQFFLQVIATKDVDKDLLFHCLRLIGNSSADTDENRQIVVSDNHTLSIMRLILVPDLSHVAIPVIYNICTDFEPAQSQVAANRLGYILLKSIVDGTLNGNALLNYTYELIEMTSGQSDGIENSPAGTIILIMQIALREDTSFAQFTCLMTCLTNYLQTERFQTASVQFRLVEQVVSVLQQSFSVAVDDTTPEDIQLLNQLRLKLNQALGDIAALPSFLDTYPIHSPLLDLLQSWLTVPEDTLQIGACLILGNVARTDESCHQMIEELNIHPSLINILKNNTRGGVLHAVLGFLKNLSIAESNREKLGHAGIISAVSQVWTYDSVPQVQLAATSVIRLVIGSSLKNISRLLTSLSPDLDSPAHSRTYLSMLLSLYSRTDTAPIKTEIGRTVCSICRTLISRSQKEDTNDETTTELLDRLFDLHDDIARPIGAMITQTEWPVVRSEGCFALALMASNEKSCLAVVDCIVDTDVFMQVEKGLDSEDESVTTETNDQIQSQKKKDRDNLVIMVKELLSKDPESLPEGIKIRLRELMNKAVSSLSSAQLDC